MRGQYDNEYYGTHRPVYPNELYHYGVKGMRWGIVNEYEPIGRKPAKKVPSSNIRRFIDTKKVRSAKKFLKEASRKTADVTLDFLSGTGIIGQLVAGSINRKRFDKQREDAKKTDKNGVKLQDPPPNTTLENLERSNPNFYTRQDSYTNNCTNCSMTFEARQRGYEVEAAPLVGRSILDTFSVLQEVYPGAQPNFVVPPIFLNHEEGWPSTEEEMEEYYQESFEQQQENGENNEILIKKVMDAMSKEPPGSRGQLLVYWNHGGGHALNYEITKDRKLVVYCPQTGKEYRGYTLTKFLRSIQSLTYTRLDNCDINTKALKERDVSI